MKFLCSVSLLVVFAFTACKPAKQIQKTIATRDTVIVDSPRVAIDSVEKTEAFPVMDYIHANTIEFQTFSAKIKVDVQAKDNVPELTANIRMIKDSAIWISLQATFLGLEVYRALITKDAVILLNKQEKTVQFRSLDYLQEVTQIPFDFKSLQALLVGNPIFVDSGNINYQKNNEFLLVKTISDPFKNLLTFNLSNKQLLQCKLDDIDINRNRTASISYDEYSSVGDQSFSNKRKINITEKNNIGISLNFKQVEFNKQLSVAFSVPAKYKRK